MPKKEEAKWRRNARGYTHKKRTERNQRRLKCPQNKSQGGEVEAKCTRTHAKKRTKKKAMLIKIHTKQKLRKERESKRTNQRKARGSEVDTKYTQN